MQAQEDPFSSKSTKLNQFQKTFWDKIYTHIDQEQKQKLLEEEKRVQERRNQRNRGRGRGRGRYSHAYRNQNQDFTDFTHNAEEEFGVENGNQPWEGVETAADFRNNYTGDFQPGQEDDDKEWNSNASGSPSPEKGVVEWDDVGEEKRNSGRFEKPKENDGWGDDIVNGQENRGDEGKGFSSPGKAGGDSWGSAQDGKNQSWDDNSGFAQKSGDGKAQGWDDVNDSNPAQNQWEGSNNNSKLQASAGWGDDSKPSWGGSDTNAGSDGFGKPSDSSGGWGSSSGNWGSGDGGMFEESDFDLQRESRPRGGRGRECFN